LSKYHHPEFVGMMIFYAENFKKMKTIKVFIQCLCSICCLLSAVFSQQKIKNTRTVPILAWSAVRPDEASVARFIEMKDAGFNIGLAKYSSADSMEQSLDMAAKAGIQLIVRCPELETETIKTVKRFKKHSAVAGYYLKDEPNRADFPALGNLMNKIRSVDDKHFCYLNLFPNIATPELLGTKGYKEYLDTFLQEVPVELLSFDHYPIIENPKTSVRSFGKLWYENLEAFAAISAKTNKPFWAFALSVPHGLYPPPTIAELKLQVYSDLAYGAQGIAYFTYWTPLIKSKFNYRHGPITDDTKQRTEVYDRIQLVNKEIQNLSGVFMGAKLVSVAHTGDKIPKGTKAFQQQQLPKIIEKLETVGDGAVVSHLQNGIHDFLVIVNRDFAKSMQLTIKGDDQLKKVLKDGTIVPANVYVETMEVDPGDAAIYMWERSSSEKNK
jgi:hypothetical protein